MITIMMMQKLKIKISRLFEPNVYLY